MATRRDGRSMVRSRCHPTRSRPAEKSDRSVETIWLGPTRPWPSSPRLTAADWVAETNGAVHPYGDATNDGSMAGQHLNAPIIAATGCELTLGDRFRTAALPPRLPAKPKSLHCQRFAVCVLWRDIDGRDESSGEIWLRQSY